MVVAVPYSLAALAKSNLETEAQKLVFSFEEVPSEGTHPPVRMRDNPYFTTEVPNAARVDDVTAPLEFSVYSTDFLGAKAVPLQFGQA